MTIPESQLETWSHQGAIIKSRDAYASVKRILEATATPYASKSFEVFLQGSYGNDTNIWADSDVDIVIRLDSIMRSDLSKLSPEEQRAYNATYPDATYRFSEFKLGVVAQLKEEFDKSNVDVGNKSVKIKGTSNRMSSDVVVCFQYRRYKRFLTIDNQEYVPGIIFSAGSGIEIINYPKLHSERCTAKHKNTDKYFKPTVRILKNMRGWMVENGLLDKECAPSYFIEGLLYNAPDDKFGHTFGDTICNCVNWLLEADWSKFVCPNHQFFLLGNRAEQWQEDKGREFLDALGKMWKDW